MELFGLGLFLLITILLALAFDFANGFHDSANAIATVVATKVLSPGKAVIMAGIFNFLGPFLFTLAVANTIGKGIIDIQSIGPQGSDIFIEVIFAALMGALVWNLITWYYGLPSSSSHALVGGLIGGALAGAGAAAVLMPKWSEWSSIVDTMVNGGDFWKFGALEWAIAGSLFGLAAGLLAFLWSRTRLPKPFLWIFIAIGLLAGLYLGYSLGAGKEGYFEMGLLMLSFGFMGVVAGALFWIMTQQKMGIGNLPAFAVFGAAVTLVAVTLGNTLKLGGISKTLLFMVVSPMLGFLSGFLLASVVSWTGREMEPATVSKRAKGLQMGSAAFYALTHGTNDAQKTMGVIGVLLFGAGAIALDSHGNLEIPFWVFIASAAAMGLGTMLGGWRIVKTMANKLTHLRPYQGFAAETGGGVVLVAMAQAGAPVSTTHAITASIMGVGATRRASAVRWGTGRRIIAAWVITIPAAGLVAFVTFWILQVL